MHTRADCSTCSARRRFSEWDFWHAAIKANDKLRLAKPVEQDGHFSINRCPSSINNNPFFVVVECTPKYTKKKGGIRTEASSVHAKCRGGERDKQIVKEGGKKEGEDLSLSAGQTKRGHTVSMVTSAEPKHVMQHGGTWCLPLVVCKNRPQISFASVSWRYHLHGNSGCPATKGKRVQRDRIE
ncbi:hypothetical protein C0J45_0496 [Silurus meridionalis]|nr:hypothetical protein C0J45_0496 [Silurus meridionalis]